MAELLWDIIHWMEALAPAWAYAVILVVAYGENVVPPIPGDMVVVFGGYLVGVGKLSFPIVVLLATIGGALGFMTMYAIGYRIGHAIHTPGRMRWLPRKGFDKAEHWIRRWGYGVVLANRFLSGLRSVISLAVGVAQMDPWRTALFAALSALVWTLLIAYAGYTVGHNWEQVSVYLGQYGRIIVALMLLFAVVQGVRYVLRRRARRR